MIAARILFLDPGQNRPQLSTENRFRLGEPKTVPLSAGSSGTVNKGSKLLPRSMSSLHVSSETTANSFALNLGVFRPR
jgi:hypothetical protein